MINFNRTNELNKAIMSILKHYCDRCFYRKAKKHKEYPYLTFNLRYTKDEHEYKYFFEVHVWTKDDKGAEELADKIEEIDGTSYKNEYSSFEIYLNTRNNMEDEDEELNHIVILFDLLYFDVKG